MTDDRLPIVLVILDGLGDRICAELGHQTPSEAAATPVLDELAVRGCSGLHVPFGPGRATSSEVSHWSLFGFEAWGFPGRAALEGLGMGLEPPRGVPLFHLALRAATLRGGSLGLGARARAREDDEDAAALFAALEGRVCDGISFELMPLRTGECVLVAAGAPSHEVSDTDALFEHLHPWMRPRALAEAADPEAAASVASALESWLREGHRILSSHPVNVRRRQRGRPALEIPVTKWASLLDPGLPSFEEHVGLRGAAVTDTALYRGLARLLGMRRVQLDPGGADLPEDMAARVGEAQALLGQADFVHVHVKAPDEAGHRKDPRRKRAVIEALDAGLEGLLPLAQRAIVALTGDHATPSSGSLLHSGDPTPLLVAGPGVAADAVERFGERHARQGTCGRLAAAEILPLLAGLANRPFFLGHRPGARRTLALPGRPEAMPID